MYARTLTHMLFILFVACLMSPPAQAAEQDETLTLLGQPLVADSVAGRLPRQLSRTAENTTVVTARDIEALNAHTLIDILATIPGIQLESQIGSANGTYTRIQGSNFSHVLVLLDGIPYNNLGDNFSDIGQIPARIIDRIEIVKGAASSAWGQALGGVINIITKTPDADQRTGGVFTVAHGEQNSKDLGAELSGSVAGLGYYLSGGYLGSNGFTTNTGFDSSHGHIRLTKELPHQGQAALLVNYARHERGDFAYAPFDFRSNDDARRLVLGLSLRQPLGSHLELNLDSFYSDNRVGIDTAAISDNHSLQAIKSTERLTGGGARLLWRQSGNLLITGVDYQYAYMFSSDPLTSSDLLNRRADRWGFYLNDTCNIGRISLVAGARYDLTGTSGDQFSPSLGLTWQLTDNTILRGYTASGFSLPSFGLERGSERVWTSQVGIETSALTSLWLKGTLFRNDTWDISTYDSQSATYLNERQLKQGFELEARTAEAYNLSFRSGYSYVSAHRTSDDSVVHDVPSHTVQLAVQYDDHSHLKGLLTGRHIFWNAEPYKNGSYGGMLWDLHLNATPFSGDLKGMELFFSLRNIFNGSQYLDEIYHNNGRWAEGGLRLRF